MRRFAAVFMAVLAAMSVACGDNAIPTEPTDIGPFSRTEVFAGTLAPGGTASIRSRPGNAGSVVVTFASARVINTSTTLSPTLTLGFGVPRGTDCQTSQTVQASPALQAQIARHHRAGHLLRPHRRHRRACRRRSISRSRMTFAVEPTSTPATSPQTDMFNSLLAARRHLGADIRRPAGPARSASR